MIYCQTDKNDTSSKEVRKRLGGGLKVDRGGEAREAEDITMGRMQEV